MSYADLGESAARTRIEKWRHRVADTVVLMQDAAPWAEHEEPHGFPIVDVELGIAPYVPGKWPRPSEGGGVNEDGVAGADSVTRSGQRYDQSMLRMQALQRRQKVLVEEQRQQLRDERMRELEGEQRLGEREQQPRFRPLSSHSRQQPPPEHHQMQNQAQDRLQQLRQEQWHAIEEYPGLFGRPQRQAQQQQQQIQHHAIPKNDIAGRTLQDELRRATRDALVNRQEQATVSAAQQIMTTRAQKRRGIVAPHQQPTPPTTPSPARGQFGGDAQTPVAQSIAKVDGQIRTASRGAAGDENAVARGLVNDALTEELLEDLKSAEEADVGLLRRRPRLCLKTM